MSNIIISDTILYSILVSLFTQGLSASSSDGALLSPLRLWMESFNKALDELYAKHAIYQQQRRMNKQASYWIDKSLSLIKHKIWLRSLWHKPLLTCVNCMPSVWGIIIFATMYSWDDIHILLLGVPIASILTSYTKKLRS